MKTNSYMIKSALVGALGGLLFGFDTGFPFREFGLEEPATTGKLRRIKAE